MNIWLAFVLLQVADTLTTLFGLSLGAREINPVGSWMMSQSGSPALNILISKIMGTATIYLTCFYFNKDLAKIIRCLNKIFIFLVIWNVGTTGVQIGLLLSKRQ